MLHSLKARLGLLFLGFAVLFSLSALATLRAIEAQEQDAVMINLAGQQRMLVQQMTHNALHLDQYADEASRTALTDAADTFEQTLHALVAGGSVTYPPDRSVLIPATQDLKTLAALKEVQDTWTIFRAHLGRISATEPDADPDAASWGTNRVDVFVRWSDNTLRRRWSTDGGLTWSDWQNLGDVMASGPTAVARQSNYLDLYWRGANDSLWSRWWDGTNWVNARDIGDNAGWGSWSSEPWSLNGPNHRACLYNLKLGDNPWNGTPYLNHTLHEFGHALGLSHEHSRPDANAGCTEKGYGGGGNAGLLTPYDRDSVMHYAFASCGIEGNYGNSGLSAYDRLALHIMYPEDVRVVEFYGNTVIRAGQPLQLTSAWHVQGATAFTTKNWVWKVDGVTHSTTSALNLAGLSAGAHTLTVEHDDFLDRHYTYSGKVQVLTATDYDTLAAVQAANQAVLAPIVYDVNLPLVAK